MRRRRADGLFDQVATFGALCAASSRAALGKRRGSGPAAFLANLETEILALECELRAGTWRPGGYVSFEIRDPKRRTISAAPFRDRVVHHAVIAVIAPLFERGFIDHTYANRAGKGTHRALARYERLRDRHRRGERVIWDYRVMDWITVDAYLFNARIGARDIEFPGQPGVRQRGRGARRGRRLRRGHRPAAGGPALELGESARERGAAGPSRGGNLPAAPRLRRQPVRPEHHDPHRDRRGVPTGWVPRGGATCSTPAGRPARAPRPALGSDKDSPPFWQGPGARSSRTVARGRQPTARVPRLGSRSVVAENRSSGPGGLAQSNPTCDLERPAAGAAAATLTATSPAARARAAEERDECVFRPKWNTGFGRSGTSISEEVEHRFREVEHGFRDVEHPFRGKWNGGSGVVNARR